MKRIKLIFFMSLILILILGTTSQANLDFDFINYTFDTLEKYGNWGDNDANFKGAISALTTEQIKSIELMVNNSLIQSEINDKCFNKNCTVLTGYNDKTSMHIYFIFSSPLYNQNMPWLYLSRYNNTDYWGCYGYTSDMDPMYMVKLCLTYNSTNKTTSILNNGLYKVTSERYLSFYRSNFIIKLTSGGAYVVYNRDVVLGSTLDIRITYPWDSSQTQVQTWAFLFNYSAFLGEDKGYYDPNPTPTPTPSGDSGGTVKPNPSGDSGNTGNTGNVDLSKVERWYK